MRHPGRVLLLHGHDEPRVAEELLGLEECLTEQARDLNTPSSSVSFWTEGPSKTGLIYGMCSVFDRREVFSFHPASTAHPLDLGAT